MGAWTCNCQDPKKSFHACNVAVLSSQGEAKKAREENRNWQSHRGPAPGPHQYWDRGGMSNGQYVVCIQRSQPWFCFYRGLTFCSACLRPSWRTRRRHPSGGRTNLRAKLELCARSWLLFFSRARQELGHTHTHTIHMYCVGASR